MPVKESPVVYTTSDGREFKDKAAAEEYQKLVDLKEDYEIAKRKFNVALAKNYKTADGQPIQIGLCSDFYTVGYGMGIPQIRRITLSCDDVRFCERVGELEIVEYVREDQQRGYSNSYRRHEYKASSLYKSETAATRAVVKLQEEWLAQETAQLEKTKANLLTRRDR